MSCECEKRLLLENEDVARDLDGNVKVSRNRFLHES